MIVEYTPQELDATINEFERCLPDIQDSIAKYKSMLNYFKAQLSMLRRTRDGIREAQTQCVLDEASMEDKCPKCGAELNPQFLYQYMCETKVHHPDSAYGTGRGCYENQIAQANARIAELEKGKADAEYLQNQLRLANARIMKLEVHLQDDHKESYVKLNAEEAI